MRWLLGCLALLAAGSFFRLGLLAYAMYALLGLLLLSRLLARAWSAGLQVSRTGASSDGKFNIGQQATIKVGLRNDGWLRVPWVLVEDSLPREAMVRHPPAIRVTGDALALLTLGPCESSELEYAVEFLARGYYQFGPLLIENGDLFGLHRHYRVASEPHFLLVHPEVVPLEGYDLASKRPIGEVRITHRSFEDPTRFGGIRAYERGDPMNRIHWRATARAGSWQSKTYEPSCIAGASLLLDFHRKSYSREDRIVRSELAVTTAASLANAVCLLGQQVGLTTNGRDAADRMRIEGPRYDFRTRANARSHLGMHASSDRLEPLIVETRRGPDQFHRILDALARIEMTDGFEFPELIEEVRSRLPRDATAVAILPEVPERTAIALGNLRRSGFSVMVVMVMFGEEKYHDWAEAPEWASRLLSEGIPFRRVDDRASLASLCASHFVR